MTETQPVTPVDCPGWTEDGNAFAIMGKIGRCLRRAGRRDEVEAFTAEATAGDYDHLIQTAVRWTTDFGDDEDDEDDEDEWSTPDVEVGGVEERQTFAWLTPTGVEFVEGTVSRTTTEEDR